jgi:hypothetical protein
MRKICVILIVSAAAFLSACSSARVTTEIKKDGSFKRTIALTGSMNPGGGPAASPTTIENTFVIPSGNGWKVVPDAEKPASVSAVSAVSVQAPVVTSKKDNTTQTFERLFAAGTPVKGDLSIKAPGKTPGKLQLVNEVTVTNIGPNRYEYKEVLRWVGAPQKTPEFSTEDLADIKAQLPPGLATDANARGLAERAYKLMIPMIYGPGDPLIDMGFMHPDLAVHRMTQKIGGTLLKAIDEQFGDKMTADQKRELAKNLISKTFDSSKPKQPDPTATTEKQDSGSLTPLTFVLRAPGKLISTNGDYDELSGEVYWAMYPEGASYQPVTLTAIFEVK